MTDGDAAAIDRLPAALERLAPVLEAFNRFDGPDDAVTRRDAWLDVFDHPLPVDVRTGRFPHATGVILERLRRETPYVPSSTLVGGRLAIRPCYTNPRTTMAEVDGLVDAVVRLGDEEMTIDGAEGPRT